MAPGRSLVVICPQCKEHVVASEEQHMIYNDGPPHLIGAFHW